MQILILGAGAIGGYFGARLLQASRDVTFLVRPHRQLQLAQTGLCVQSPHGDACIDKPPTVLASDIRVPADLILFCCKAYDLEEAIESIRPAVGPGTMILPLLNGMKHLDRLSEAYGKEAVLGGQCVIATQVNDQGIIVQLNANQSLSFGELSSASSERTRTLSRTLGVTNVDARLSDVIQQEMWEKWVMLATLAGITCLMRAPLGDVLASPGGEGMIKRLFEECRRTADDAGFAPRSEFVTKTLTALTTPDSLLTASMLRDIESGRRVEADHVLGDLLARAAKKVVDRSTTSMLAVAYAHVKSYEHRRQRTQPA